MTWAEVGQFLAFMGLGMVALRVIVGAICVVVFLVWGLRGPGA